MIVYRVKVRVIKMKKVYRFTASYCQPCKALAKNLEAVQTDKEISVYDIDENLDFAMLYNVRGVPTLVMIENDEEVKRISGVHSTTFLQEWLNS